MLLRPPPVVLALRFELPPERQGESAEEEEEEEDAGRGRGRRARDAPSRDTTRGFGVAAALLAAAATGAEAGESARFLEAAWELELEAAPGVAAEPRELWVFPPEDDENRARRRRRFSSSDDIWCRRKIVL